MAKGTRKRYWGFGLSSVPDEDFDSTPPDDPKYYLYKRLQ